MSSSTTTTHPTSSTLAPWYPLFSSHLDTLGSSPEFTFASISPTGQPHVRTCIHRGFFCRLPENKHNKLPKNPPIYASECPTFTNDARMEKTYDVFATGRGKGTPEQARSGTGGGGPIEACYWVKGDIMCQWRIRGKCWFLGVNDIDDQNSGTVTAKAELGRYMRDLSADSGSADANNAAKNEWSWKREIENHFGNLSPTMKGSFKNPPPGTPIANGAGKGEKLGQKAGELMEEGEGLARENFRVAVITPVEVECVDLKDPEKGKRQRWTLSEESGGPAGEGKPVGEWNMIELWP
ncbi:MAG: hypothetical protein Q9160_001095 [Pyrenula sp. 1 TL-2023]